MKILIHALGATMGGAMRHLTNFLPELGILDRSNEFYILARESLPLSFSFDNIHIIRVNDKVAKSWGARFWHDVVLLPSKLRNEKFTCIVSLTNFGPIWTSIPHIFFQRNSIYYCPYYLKRVNSRLRVEAYLRRKLALASMMRADLIVTPSHGMADMIRVMCPETASRNFKVLYHGFAKESLRESLNPKYVDLLSKRGGVRLLYPTHAAPHKGFDVLFDALGRVRDKVAEFTLYTTISRDDWPEGISQFERQIADLDLTERVVFMGNVPQRQMGALYSQCDLMVYPSLCESFGFSMIEALGYGLPVVAADTAVNREMCEKGAIYYSALDPDSAAEAICKALITDTNQHMREAGKARVKDFDWSWKRYAREFVEMIETVK